MLALPGRWDVLGQLVFFAERDRNITPEIDDVSLDGWEGSAASVKGRAGAAAVGHDGASNFAIWGYGSRSDLLINEIGPYIGTVRWMAGPVNFTVSADGTWSVTLQ